MLTKRSYLFFALLFCWTQLVWAQMDTFRIVETYVNHSSQASQEITIVEQSQVTDFLNEIITKLISDNHLEANIDSIIRTEKGDLETVYLHKGTEYKFKQLTLDSSAQELLNKLKLKNPGSSAEYLKIRNQLTEYYGDRGYPFTKIVLDSFTLRKGLLEGQLRVEPGKQVIIDSLIIKGDLKLRHSYLQNYLDIHRGEPYNHSKIKSLRRKLDRLTFLSNEKDPELSFINNYASVNLFLKSENTSRFDLIFGVIPTTMLGDRTLFLSLDFTTELYNKLGYGEYILLDFERLRPEQQQLDIRFDYPYLLDTPFAIATRFSIFRNSLDYQTVLTDLGLQYFISSSDKVKMSYYSEASKVVEVDTTTALSGALPEDLSVTQNGLALELDISRLDYLFNPRRGYAFKMQAIFGTKKILRDPALETIRKRNQEFATKYDSLDLKAPRYELRMEGSIFKPIARRGALGFIVKSGYKYSPSMLVRNELFQLGGNKLLRGFDEASIFTQGYAISTFEYRLAIGRNSYFQMPYLDIGAIISNEKTAFVAGLGAGLVMETKVGMFNFSVAVGKSPGVGFDFGRPKAHFGFISLF